MLDAKLVQTMYKIGKLVNENRGEDPKKDPYKGFDIIGESTLLQLGEPKEMSFFVRHDGKVYEFVIKEVNKQTNIIIV